MRTEIACLTFALIGSSTLAAQWPDYKVAGVPRTADGKVDMKGPTPRTADGHPDLSGVWQYMRPPNAPPPPRPTPPAPGTQPDIIPLAVRTSQFWNLGASFKDGLPFQPWAAELHRKRVELNSIDNPDAHCLPIGVMQLHTHGQPRKMVQTPGVTVIMYEANSGLRQIFTDGRPLPKDAEPWWYGYSVGKWEGDTLVVKTMGFNDLSWLDARGTGHSEDLRVEERFHRRDYGHLEMTVTVTDPKTFTKPVTFSFVEGLLPDTDVLEHVCAEDEKDVAHVKAATGK